MPRACCEGIEKRDRDCKACQGWPGASALLLNIICPESLCFLRCPSSCEKSFPGHCEGVLRALGPGLALHPQNSGNALRLIVRTHPIFLHKSGFLK